MNNMPLMAVFGGGNIGRGFIGQIFVQAGYEVVFIDASADLINELNRVKYYPLQLVSNTEDKTLQIGPVSACPVQDSEQVNNLIARADIMATAVGVPILPHIAATMAKGFAARKAAGNNRELDILVCENKLGAGDYLKTLILNANPDLEMMLSSKIGFVETSIGRMVPVLSAEERSANPLLIRSEPYNELPVDAAGFRGPIPQIPNIRPFTPFHFYHERKLFIHNMGHAVAAYLGALAGVETIAEAVSRPKLRRLIEKAMQQVGKALSKHYNVEYNLLEEHIQDLLTRFGNHKLGDTVARVGRDPLRKLDAVDRLAGAFRFLIEQGEDPVYIAFAISAAMMFQAKDDPTADQVQKMIRDMGADRFLQEHCGLRGSSEYEHWRTFISTQLELLEAILIE